IPGIGLKDGVLLELVSQLRDREKDVHRQQVIESARRLGKKYFFEEKHANTVARLALQIFDQTTSFHELDSEARLVLEVAALLHDIGHYERVQSPQAHLLPYSIQPFSRTVPASNGFSRERCAVSPEVRSQD